MSDVTVDRKLELVRQVKEQYAKNQNDLSRREQILYGTSFRKTADTGNPGMDPSEDTGTGAGTFRIRLLLAVLLLGAVVYMERSGQEFAGITSADIYQAIETDRFMTQFPLPDNGAGGQVAVPEPDGAGGQETVQGPDGAGGQGTVQGPDAAGGQGTVQGPDAASGPSTTLD